MPTTDDVKRAPAPAVAIKALARPRKLLPGRATKSANDDKKGIIPRPQDWKIEDIEPEDLGGMPTDELLYRLHSVSPELSRARFDFLRMANPGYTLVAVKPGTDDPDEAATENLRQFAVLLGQRHGSLNMLFNRFLSNFWLRGAGLGELVLDRSGRFGIDILIPDASTVWFRNIDDPDLGVRWEMVQKQGSAYVNIERETVKYVAWDALPDSPYGTPPISSALFPAIFLLTMLMDARRVIAQQGWPRQDISIDEQRIVAMMPPDDQDNPEEVREWVLAAVNEVSSVWDTLTATSAYVHSETVKVNPPVGAFGNLQGINAITEMLERQIVRALKTMPLLMAVTDSTGEANANRQWEVHAASITAIQDAAEQPLSDLFTIHLEAQGILAEARLRFNVLRSVEEKREAETQEIKLRNSREMRSQGFVTWEEASLYAIGREPDESLEEPAAPAAPAEGGDDDATTTTTTPSGEDDNETTGETGTGEENGDRSVEPVTRLLPAGQINRAPLEPAGSPESLGPLPIAVVVSDSDVDRATAEWDATVPDAAGLLNVPAYVKGDDGDG